MSQAPNLGRLLCRSKFESQGKNNKVKNRRKNCVSCPYLLKASLYQFKQVNGMSKRDEKANKYLRTTYKTAATSTISSCRTFM